MHSDRPWRRRIALAAAVVLLDASLTFHNIWPTPAIAWHGELSVEFAVGLLALLAGTRWGGPASRAALGFVAAAWTLLVVSHYADVTSPALYGREVNLYWDVRLLSNVTAMLASAASRWRVILAALAAAVILVLVYRVMRWAVGRVADAADRTPDRHVLGLLALSAALVFAGQRVAGLPRESLQFPTPVTATYVRQLRLVLNARAAAGGARLLAASPSMHGDMARIKGADVFLMFIESYGAVSYERPEFAERLSADRARLDAAIRETHREVVSAYVESPTFGGSSWLAHVTLLSGIEVRDPDTNALLMTQKRDTLVTAFARQGYRTVAVMPGLWQGWPEGAFYGFDDIYGGSRLDYRGPPFGWWDIPDQFAIAKMDALEVNRSSRPPVFVFFPTISTHIPFTPTPPYQRDWPRIFTETPYDDADLDRAFDKQPDWLDLGPSYADAMSYAYQSLAGYLRLRADRDFVMILLGDHQPAAAVTGEGASWNVPVHVIASRRPVLNRLLAHGFREGLTPARPALGHMQALVPILLDAFGTRDVQVARAR